MEELNNNTDNSNEDSNTNLNHTLSNISPSLVHKYLHNTNDNNNNNNHSYSIDPMNSPSLSVMTTEQQQYVISSADIYTWKLKKTHDG
jgi:hypothetical protein